MYRVVSTLYLLLLLTVPMATVGIMSLSVERFVWRLIFVVLAPIVYGLTHLLLAGFLSMPFHRFILPGLFPRELGHPIYCRRRLYGLCWIAVYYFTPLYHFALCFPSIRWALFKSFGYRGRVQFTIYPDTWVRDLPLLSFGEGAYLANRATLGSNLHTPKNGNILVGPITMGKNSLLGHLSILGLGSRLGDRAEIAMDTLIGIRVEVGDDATVGSGAAVDHGTNIRARAKIGPLAYIGQGAEIGEDVVVPAGACIPRGTLLQSQADADDLERSETISLHQERADALNELTSQQYGDDHVS